MRILILWFVVTAWVMALPADIQYFLTKSKLPKKDVSIYIQELDTGRVVASLNANTTRKPASVIKVLTGYAALLKVGFDYRWPTEFYTSGTIKSGHLNGDLIIKGYGDPSLGSKHLSDIILKIRRRGIEHINGDIVIDRSYFDVGDKDSAEFDNYPYSPYNALPDAMMFNERTSTVCITPKKKTAHKEIEDPSYEVVNQVKFVNRSCRGKYAWAGSKVDMQSEIPQLILKGELSKHCKERKVCKIVTKPYKAFYYALKEALAQEGIEINGKMRLAKVPSSARLLFTHYSEPLEKIVSKSSKKSNNIYARHLMLLAGAKMYGAPATVAKGRKAVTTLLKAQGALGKGTLYLDNGSGLSRKSKMSAKMLADVQKSAYRVYGKRWMKTLSIAGKDGTIKKRFRYKPAQSRAWMKTGTLKHVKNIGGYVKNKAGNHYNVVILVNTKKGRHRATKLQNDIINWLAQTSKAPSSKSSSTKVAKPVSKPFSDVEVTKSVSSAKPQKKSTGNFYIQVVSVAQKPNKAYFQKIEKSGFAYKVVRDKHYKVLIGGYPSKAAAQKALHKVRKELSKGAFIVTR